MKKGLAVLFPGIGYTNDRSLLYFSGRLAENAGYELMRVSYTGFRKGIKGDPEKMREAFFLAREQAMEQLGGVSWDEYENVVFISKSIGTVVASEIAAKVIASGSAGAMSGASPDAIGGGKVRSVVFTPLKETFLYLEGDAIVFHGTADPWAKTEDIVKGCSERNIPLFITENANHSLETGEVETDLRNLETVMERVRELIIGAAGRGK